MKRILTLLTAFTLILALSFSVLAADILEPSSDFYVTDEAGTLSADTKHLIDYASGPLERDCDGAQICVVTINYLPQGYDSEQYAWLLFNEWGVGDADANNGILLLHVVMEDRGWLAVGSGLTASFDTNDANELLDRYFWPLSDAGEYDEAVATLFPHLVDVYEEIYGVELYGSTSSVEGSGNPDDGYYDYYGDYHRTHSPLRSIITIIIVVLVFAVLFGGVGTARYHRRYGGWPAFIFCGGGPRGPRPPRGSRPPRGPRPPFGGGGGFHSGGFRGGGGGFRGGGFGGGGHAGGGGGRR